MAEALTTEQKALIEQIFLEPATFNASWAHTPYGIWWRTNNFVQRSLSYLFALDTTQTPNKWIPLEVDEYGRLEVASIAGAVTVQMKNYDGAAWNNVAGDSSGRSSVDLFAYDGAAFQNLLVESAAQKNLRVILYDSAAKIFTTPAAMGDATTNPTSSGLTAFPLAYNGATWDRLRTFTNAGNVTGTNYALETGCKLYGFDAANWQTLLIESATQKNLKVILTATGYNSVILPWDSDAVATTRNTLFTSTGLFGYNGVTWDRLRGDMTYGLDVDVTRTAPNSTTGSAPTAASVGIASAAAVAANANRKGLVLVNTSANSISIAFGANAAILNSGITLNPTGGTFVMDTFTFSTAAINAIAGGAASNLAIQEMT